MAYIVTIDTVCDMGLVRTNNEDMVSINGELLRDNSLKHKYKIDPDDKMIFAVADGMGGHNGGEIASEMVLVKLNQFVNTLPSGMSASIIKQAFERWIQQIHTKLNQEGLERLQNKNMGTTLVGILFYESKVFYFNAGDSRLYRFRQNILRKISTDHTLKDMGGMRNAPSNVLINSIGGGKDTFIDFVEITERVLNNDVYLLCSDGLSDLINDDTIEQTLIENIKAENLIKKAKEQGGTDNISAIVVHVSK